MAIGAAIFRDAQIAPLAKHRTIALATQNDALADWARQDAANKTNLFADLKPLGVKWEDMIASQISVSLKPGDTAPADADAGSEIKWTAGDNQDAFTTVNSYTATGLGGYARVSTTKDTTNDLPPFAAVAMAAMDGHSFADSKQILIAACARCENANMNYSADRTHVSAKFGDAPVGIEPVSLQIDPPPGLDLTGWQIIPLDPTGHPAAGQRPAGAKIDLRASDQTMWWELRRD